MNIDRQAGWCVHYWHCVFIRCVGGYSLYVILKLLGLFIIARGLGWVFWGLGGGVQVGGGEVEFLTEKKISAKKCSWGLKTPKKYNYFFEGEKFQSFFSLLNFFFQKCSWGSETHAFSGGGEFWGRAGSENNTLLPMTMICDRFWSGPAWRSKVIIQKPWRRKNKKNKIKKIK